MFLGRTHRRDVWVTTHDKGVFVPLFLFTLWIVEKSWDRCWERIQRQVAKEWSTFDEDQGVSLFSKETDVTLDLSQTNTLRWRVVLYWNGGSHVQARFVGPLFLGVEFVF